MQRVKNSKEQIILGIDPGTTIMGYGVIRCVGKKVEMLEMFEMGPSCSQPLAAKSSKSSSGR